MSKPRGKGDFYDEVKTEAVYFVLTKTAATKLREKIDRYRDETGQPLSLAEFFERWARDTL